MNSPYIIAEIGINHGGDKELALELIRGAANSGSGQIFRMAVHGAKQSQRAHFDHVHGGGAVRC